MATSCLMEEKEVFDQTPAERMDAFLSEYKEILESSENGWLFEYYPEANQSYGGYAYILKFQDGMVTAYFELADEEATSTFKMTSDDGPALSFDTYNENLHFFAEPSPDMYQGFQGDYEYKILGKSDDNSEIYLRGRKSGNNLTLKKFAREDPVAYLAKSTEISSAMMAPSYSIKINENSAACSISDNVLYYELVVKEATETTEAEVETVKCAFCYTDTGVNFYEPVVIGGVEYTSLVFNAENRTLSTEDGTVVISQIIPPLNELFTLAAWYITYSNIGSWGKPYFNAVKQQLASIGEELLLAYIGKTSTGKWGFGFYSTDGAKNYSGALDYNYELSGEDKITMQFAMSGDSNGVWYHNNAGFSYMLNVFGYNAPRTFTVSADNPKAPSYILLTEDANPNNTIKLIPTQTLYPFNN